MNSINDLKPSRIETLDFCYEKQAITLKNMLAGMQDKETIAVVNQWLHVFKNAPLQQKHARNCLALLMQEQLADEGMLSNMFINSANLKLDLNEVLNEVDRELEEMFTDSSINKRFEPDLPGLYNSTQLNKLEVPIHIENAHLRSELNLSRAKVLEQDKVIQALESQIQFEDNHGRPSKANTENILKIMIDVIAQYLSENRLIQARENGHVRLQLFESIFAWLTNENWFINQLRVFDVTFEQSLNDMLRSALSKIKTQVAADATKAFKRVHKKMRKKQKHRLGIQKRKHATQIGLIKLEIFSELRKVFVNLQSSHDPEMWKILEEMEAKYTEIADKVIKNLN